MQFVRQDVMALDDLAPFPGNARRGDTEAIAASLAQFGQYRSLVVREHWNGSGENGDGDGSQLFTIVAGNHTAAGIMLLAQLTAEELTERYGEQAAVWAGCTTARVEIISCGDAEAMKINAADNRLAELGGYDDAALLDQLQAMAGDFAGTGWTDADLQILSQPVAAPDAFPEFGPDLPTDYCCPQCGYEWSGKAK
jgi:hypothetical protein